MNKDHYSLMRGGLVYRVLKALGLVGRGRSVTAGLAILLVLLTMGPLLAMSALNGTLLPGFSQVHMALLGDYALLARFLVALPLLVVFAPICDELFRQTLSQFSRSGMVHPVQRGPFDTLLSDMQRARNSILPELACLLLALLPVLLNAAPVGMLDDDITDWSRVDGELTPAGRWFIFVATSIFRFVGLIWTWRFLLWAWLLWRLSRIDLDLRASHPDGTGGLGFLGVIQQRFSVLAFAGGVLLSGYCINHMLYLGQTLAGLKHLLLGYVVMVTMAIMAPLLVMTPRLLKAKRNGLLLYSLLGHDAVHTFDRRWLGERPADAPSLLDTGDASAICDFTSVYATIRGMSAIPISRWNLLWIAVAATLPLGPLVFFALSVDELLRRLAGILM